ncbi:hypothetical protein [Marinifilum caeruleilacunae]|uniref:WD40-like Beta Propeller Repeat n=1 Tax=Marinifilum caeruleilacunae TaxID=2499076 RepID=A0ABX1WZN3_9BACT|nr:hypothetical protein [Marinifilum caeruleilacunae]NOU61295.1 hypothetical protein [Marinifilum caeruleilacunae]
MKRRDFFNISSVGLLGTLLLPTSDLLAQKKKPKKKKKNKYDSSDLPKFRLSTLTEGPNHHFFGYYGTSPWNGNESTMVGLESSFHDRMPEPGEKAKIGLIDPNSGEFTPITETLAWNLQQGAMLHWNPTHPNKEIIFNDRINNEMASIRLDIETGQKTILPRTISAVSKKGKFALSLTYGRLSRMRKVVGYADAVDPYANEAHPYKDGVFLIDLEKNKAKLVVSIAEVFDKSVGKYPFLANRHIWFNHTDINPSGTRFLFLARSRNEKGKIDSAMFTANMDGSDLKMVIPFGTGVSHFGWRNDTEIVATYKNPKTKEYMHYLFTDGENDFSIIGENFIIDNGHCTFSPDGRYLATDRTEDDSNSTSLWLFDLELNKGLMLANIAVPHYKYLHSDTRCDFHPRWNPAGNKICFDAVDTATHTRQMHLIEFLDL